MAISTIDSNGLTNPLSSTTFTSPTLTTPTLNSPTITGAVVSSMASSVITSGTSVPTTSGTSILVASSIPSWVKRVTITFNNISTSSTSNVVMQLGTGGTLTTSGYSGGSSRLGTAQTANSTYFNIIGNNAAANVYSGILVLVTTGSNIWYSSGNISSSGGDGTCVSSGLVSLAGTLERISLTTTSTDTFDLGSVNILYE